MPGTAFSMILFWTFVFFELCVSRRLTLGAVILLALPCLASPPPRRPTIHEEGQKSGSNSGIFLVLVFGL